MGQKWSLKRYSKYFELNENGNTIYQNSRSAVLRGKLIALKAYIRRELYLKMI